MDHDKGGRLKHWGEIRHQTKGTERHIGKRESAEKSFSPGIHSLLIISFEIVPVTPHTVTTDAALKAFTGSGG